MRMIFRSGEHSGSVELIEIRVEYLKEGWGTLTEEQETVIRKQLSDYVKRHLGGDLTAYMAEENGRLVGMILTMVMGELVGPSATNDRTGTLMNAHVHPEYRKLGLGVKLAIMALEDIRRKELCHVNFHAMVRGRRLYEYLGFQRSESRYIPMVSEP